MKLEKNVGNSQLRLENYRICKFIWNIVNVPCTRQQIKYVCMFAQREYDLHFYVKRDCLLLFVNVELFFEFSVMRKKANYFCVKVFS